MTREVTIGPNPGPQSWAFASNADITVFGSGAGTGKSYLAQLRFGVHADRMPGYFGAVFRREMPMITAGGGLWEESMGLFPVWGARPNIANHEWRWPNRSLVQFRGLQHEKDMLNYQGAQFAEFCFDEATHFTARQFWWMFSRLRTKLRETHGFKARCILTCNPDPDSWVRDLIDWYIGEDGFPDPERSGKKRYFVRDGDVLVWGSTPGEVREKAPHITCDPHNQPKSLRFIPAKLADNPKGDPTYQSRLNALDFVTRSQLLGGNWNIRPAAGTLFKRSWYEILDTLPMGDPIVKIGRYWDLAATEPSPQSTDPDWTRGVKLSKHRSGLYVVHDVASVRARPHEVERLIKSTAQQDGVGVTVGFWQDPGAAGKSEAERMVREMAGYHVKVHRASSDKVTYAKPSSSQAENGNVKLLRGAWNDAYLSEHEAFPDGGHDDIVDAESLGFLDFGPIDSWAEGSGYQSAKTPRHGGGGTGGGGSFGFV